MGVRIVTNFIVGRTRTIEQLMKEDGFDAVYIGVGAGLPSFMNIEGESLVGVYSANEYLTRANLMKAYQFGAGADTPIARSKRVAVVGGGNVAMDSARTAVRLGAEKVYLIYRRTEKEMPARVEEAHHAKQEGVEFHLLQNPKRILGDANGNVTALECLRYELGEPDASGRRRPVAIPGSEFQLEVDTVIIAIGNLANPLIRQTTPGSSSTGGATSSSMRTAGPRCRVSSPVGTSSSGPPRSSSPWARAASPRPPSTSTWPRRDKTEQAESLRRTGRGPT